MWKNKNGETGSGSAFALPDDEVIRQIKPVKSRVCGTFIRGLTSNLYLLVDLFGLIRYGLQYSAHLPFA